MKKLIALSLLLIVPALAQQPQQTPSQVAIQINSVVGQWAQTIEAQQKEISDLRRELAATIKERDELKAKEKENAK